MSLADEHSSWAYEAYVKLKDHPILVFHIFLLWPVCALSAASAVNLEGELFKDLMKGYNKNIRPMENSGDVTRVDIKMTLTNLISLVSGTPSGDFD